MTSTAPKSSTMASATKKVTNAGGTRLPNNTKAEMAKAMSVAIGIPQPAAPSSPEFMPKYISAGNAIPPTAASMGKIATLMLESSPTSTSRFISSPMMKKKIAIKPSFIQ